MLTFKVFAAWVWSSLSGQRDMAAIFNLNLELLIKFKKIHFEHMSSLSQKWTQHSLPSTLNRSLQMILPEPGSSRCFFLLKGSLSFQMLPSVCSYVSSECWAFLCIIVESLSYSIQQLNVTVVIWYCINKTIFSLTESTGGDFSKYLKMLCILNNIFSSLFVLKVFYN